MSPEKSLNDAAQAAVKQFNLSVQDQDNTRVNGFPAIVLESVQIPEQAQGQQQQQAADVRILSYFIDYGDFIYVFHGVSDTQGFNTYYRDFRHTMDGFKALTDNSKIQVEPTRLKIQTVRKGGTLNSVFQDLGVARNDYEELALVNGMYLNDNIEAGELLKTFSKAYNQTAPATKNQTQQRSTTTPRAATENERPKPNTKTPRTTKKTEKPKPNTKVPLKRRGQG